MPGLPVDASPAGPQTPVNRETIAKFHQRSALSALATLYGNSSDSEDEDEENSLPETQVLSANEANSQEAGDKPEELSGLPTGSAIGSAGEVDAPAIAHDNDIQLSEGGAGPDANNPPCGNVEFDPKLSIDAGGRGTGQQSEVAVGAPAAHAFTEIRSDRNQASGTSDSDSSSSRDEDSSESDTMSDSDNEGLANVAKFKNEPRVKGEKRLCDLPPIEDLHITVPHEKCSPIGVVKSFVDPLVIVAGDPGTPALDLDSVLFLEQGDRALGKIFDVFGPVKEPHYCVRFNSKEHIESSKIECGMRVYCAPDTPHSSFILLAQLSRFRGTDASWKHDIEPPADAQEFSDDEMEEFARRGGRRHIRGRGRGATFAGSRLTPNASCDSIRGRKRQFHTDQMSAATAVVQNPFIPSNVPGFRPRTPFHRGRGRGFPHGHPHPHHFAGPPRQQFHPFQAPTNNFSMNSFNEYWSTYWANYYQHNPNPASSGSHFYQNAIIGPAIFYPPPPPPLPDASS